MFIHDHAELDSRLSDWERKMQYKNSVEREIQMRNSLSKSIRNFIIVSTATYGIISFIVVLVITWGLS